MREQWRPSRWDAHPQPQRHSVGQVEPQERSTRPLAQRRRRKERLAPSHGSARREKSENRIRALSESLDTAAFSRSQRRVPAANIAAQGVYRDALLPRGGRLSNFKGGGPGGAVGHVRQSQLAYADKDQTIIIFDWDDTLCPTTWLRSVAIFGENGCCLVHTRVACTADVRALVEGVPLGAETHKVRYKSPCWMPGSSKER
eukprot:6483974-Amphidinium_carterae.1